MFSSPTQATPASYNLNVALSHNHQPTTNGASGSNNAAANARDLEQTHQRSGRALADHHTQASQHHHEQHNNNNHHLHHHHHQQANQTGQYEQQQQQQQQLFINQSHHLQVDGAATISSLTAATFFHPAVMSAGQQTPSTSAPISAPTMTINQHPSLSRQSAHHQALNQTQQQQHLNQVNAGHTQTHYEQQQVACVVNADSFTNHLAGAGHVIFDQTHGLLRIGATHAKVLNAGPNPAAIVVNTLGELTQQTHHHQQATIPTFAVCDSNGVVGAHQYNNNSSSNSSNNNNNNNCLNGAASSKSNTSLRGGGTAIGGKRSSAAGDGSTPVLDANNNNIKRPAGETNSTSKVAANGGGTRKRKSSSKSKGEANQSQSQSQNQADNGESPRRTFACPTCNKGFTEKFNMKRHMQVHSQSRPKYVCNECSKSFAWKDNFVRHKKATHDANAPASFPV